MLLYYLFSPSLLMFSMLTAWCMYIHPASFQHCLLSQQPNTDAVGETVIPVPASMNFRYCWRRLGCLICIKLCGDSYNYKLPFVTAKQISVTTVQKCCSSLAKDLYLKKKTKANQYFIFVSSTVKCGCWLMNRNPVLYYCLLNRAENYKQWA